MGALGASRSAAERYYHGIDTCILDHALTDAEREPGIPLDARLAPLLADSARLLASPFSADTSERAQNGASYDSRCMARIAESRQGTALLAPTLLSRRPDLLFVRDLHERNAKLVSADPTKALYLLAKGPADSVPVFRLLSRDSIMGLKR